MQTVNYKISVEAGIDLEKIWRYTFETWSLEQADRYINQIFEEIAYISINPENGKDFSHIRKNYMRTKVKSHFIFYRVFNKANMVEIIRILHQQMDIENRLK